MNISKAVRNAFASSAALAAAVPGGLSAETGPARPAWPWARIHMIANPIDTWTNGKGYIQAPMIQISVFAEGEDAANAAGEAVKNAFDATQPPIDTSGNVLIMLPQQDLMIVLDPSGATGPNALPVWMAVITYRLLVQRSLP